MIAWSGIFHILATPFREDGALDTAGLPPLVESALATGITGFTILGIAGEAHRLTDEERRRVVESVVKEVRGRVPVAVGVSASGTHLATAFARMAREHGADALMVAPPAGLKNLDAVSEYYQTVAAATGLPIVLQDEPVTTQVNMPAPFIAQLCAELSRIEAVKLEEPPTLPKITRLRALFGSRVAIFGGLGGVYFFEELSRGADGAMTGYAFPELLIDVVKLSKAGKRDAAHDLFDAHLPLIRYEQQPGAGLAVRKYVLQKRGIISSSAQRKPGATITETAKAEVDYLLSRVARVDRRANLQPQSSAAG